jgi:hypothetical protein
MYHGSGDPRGAQRSLDTPAGFSPEATARAVLARLRKWLDDYTPGMPLERTLPDALTAPLADAERERERLFFRGFLHWLHDEPAAAEPLLVEAMGRARAQNALEALAESAYWLTRIRLRQGHGEALADYETVLRSLGGSPRATVWFVDLLGRAGRVDRAEQVWKSVRGHRRVAGCPEGPLLEARLLLRRGEMTPAERLLTEAAPTSGVVWVERLLLLAWIAASQRQAERARSCLQQARQGPYPPAALHTWEDWVERRLRGEVIEERTGAAAPPLDDFLKGQRHRLEGRVEPALAAYRSALDSPLAQPFARHALASLGQDDPAALLASQPGLFLAVRCRARLVVERFRRREASPAECLDALQQAAAHGCRDVAAEHFGRLAALLHQRQTDAALLGEQTQAPLTDALARNTFRAALELAVRHVPAPAARELLLEWSRRPDLDEELRVLVGRQQMRLSLFLESDETTGESAARLHDSLSALLSGGGQPSEDALRGLTPPAQAPEYLREAIHQLRSRPRWKGLAQALLVYEAAQRGEVAAVLALLDEAEAWRGLSAPPRFVLQALEYLVALQPANPGWRRSLARWLQGWDVSRLGSAGAALAAHAGLAHVRAETAEPPRGVPAVPWFLHQAAKALRRDDARAALALTRRALALDPELAGVADARVVHEALPELERRAQAQTLAAALQPGEEPPTVSAGVFADAVAALAALPDAAELLDALTRGDHAAIRVRLDELTQRPDLSPRLAHHLALLMSRATEAREQRVETEAAEPYWRAAWRCWLRFLGTADAPTRRILLDHLLTQHRHRLNDLLAQSAVDAARRHWDLVRELPGVATTIDEPLGQDLAGRVERFREELATEYLLTTREAMRYGAIPEGWRADYEKGLLYLRRLLSLDRDNPRLLTALVEICNDWFLDLYHLSDPALRTQVERFTPFALHLARRIDERPGDLSARAALADFWKFRGFLAADRAQQIALYNEALRFNPANTNVQDLLAELQGERPA